MTEKDNIPPENPLIYTSVTQYKDNPPDWKHRIKKGEVRNPIGKVKGTVNHATRKFSELRDQAGNDAAKVYGLLMDKIADGHEWAFKIFFGHLYRIPKRADRALALPKFEIEGMTIEQYSGMLIQTLMKFEDYTQDEIVAIMRTLNGLKLNEIIKEHAPGLTKEELGTLLAAVDDEINKVKMKKV